MKTYLSGRTKTPINRNSVWHYLLILVALSFLTLSALPNFFPDRDVIRVSMSEKTSVLMSSNQLVYALNKAGFNLKSVHSENNAYRIVMHEDADVVSAKEYLIQTLGGEYLVDVEKENSSPKWLKQLAGKPIKLGLDLSGGVLFVLDVDGKQAFADRMRSVEHSIKSLIRENKVRGVQVINNGESGISVKNRMSADLNLVVTDVQKQFPGLNAEYKGRRELLFFYSDSERTKFHQEIMQQSLTTMRGRIEELGITEAVVQRQGKSRIRVELPGTKSPEEVRPIIGATASLDFYQLQNSGGKSFQLQNGETVVVSPLPVFTGSHIENAHAGRDELGLPLVNLGLDSEGGKKMLKFSSKNIGKPMVTVFSEYYKNTRGQTLKKSKVISVATIQTQLGSRFSITNLESMQKAQELALLLRAGSLDAPITIAKERTITATLGGANIEKGMAALALGIGLTLIFMAMWYRRLGLIANSALIFNLVSLLGLMSLLPGAVLTLPGIAGLVLTVGMAVDTNVLIFERIKEEQRRGRALPLAIQYGYKNAFTTIFDANITTMITAVILYSIGYGPVKGFAVTLGLGILTSLFTGVFVSRVLTNLFYTNAKSVSQLQGESS